MSNTASPPLSDAVLAALATTRRGAQELLPEAEWVHKLSRSQASGKPLRIKFGMDPTAPDLHLGHTVVLNKLRQLQDLGHVAIPLIGDFTTMIGDPSGRNSTRPALSREEIEAFAQTYLAQIGRVIDMERAELRWNSEWSDALGARGLIQLAAKTTLARMLERDDFTKRYAAQTPISLHEFLYPLMQGYDSVALQSDLELGGTDQKFNLLMGRQLQQEAGQEPQCILTLPLLEGLDGVEKMSKSKGNYVGISEPAPTMFAKIMSISDTLMWRWYELLSFESSAHIAHLQAEVAQGRNPKDAKVALGREITARFHGAAAAEGAIEDFERRARGGVPDVIPELALRGDLSLGALLKASGLVPSSSEGLRKVEQGGVRIDGTVVSDKGLKLPPGTYVLQVGKRAFVRVTLSAA